MACWIYKKFVKSSQKSNSAIAFTFVLMRFARLRPVFHVRDFFGAESHDHQRAIYCHFHEHLNHAKVYHVIQVMRVSTHVNFHSSETSTRAHMVGNNEYNDTNTFPTRKVE